MADALRWQPEKISLRVASACSGRRPTCRSHLRQYVVDFAFAVTPCRRQRVFQRAGTVWRGLSEA